MGRRREVLARSSPGRALVSWIGAPAASSLACPECALRLVSHSLHAHHAPAADGHHH
ncbi:MAG TPA: hypothetical protein VLG48_02110 [Candidatus Methylomirabilis sp.]|nr:hypothetical protein [Candidatus Methylomirabilis sp.]